MVIHKNKSLMELSFFLLFLCAALSADNAFAAAMDFVSVVSRKKTFGRMLRFAGFNILSSITFIWLILYLNCLN